MNITINILNWNQPKATIRCLESIIQNTCNDTANTYSVIVVDNDSEDSQLSILEEYLNRTFPFPIQLIKNQQNLGFSGGHNCGIRHALDYCNPDYIWLLNNDIILQPNALNSLIQASTRYSDKKVWASTIYELHPNLHFHCAGGFRYNTILSIPTPIPRPVDVSLTKDLYYELPEMNYPSGASMFVKAQVFKETGLLSEHYFLYYEELDLVHQIGGKKHIAWCPASILHHEGGLSTDSKNPNTGKGSDIAHYYGNLSALKYTWLYHKWYLPMVFLFRLGAKSVLFLWHRDLAGFRPLMKAYIDFFRWVSGRK